MVAMDTILFKALFFIFRRVTKEFFLVSASEYLGGSFPSDISQFLPERGDRKVNYSSAFMPMEKSWLWR